MNILLVYPLHPATFWSFKHALRFISKKASYPPLGLLTVAAMLPVEWDVRLVDMNVEHLHDGDLQWADCIFISAMSIQTASVHEIILRCKAFGKTIVAGGPLFTSDPESFTDVDHLVLDEAEVTLPLFLDDFQKNKAQRIYRADHWADIGASPVPRWDLITKKNYASMNLQYSRGCPYDCEFCNITVLYGRKPRTKSSAQVIAELESLYEFRWRGDVFFVDDNFIGNKGRLKKEILPAIIHWMEEHKHPFKFSTEASVNLADDDELLSMMVRAGFDAVFVGIETPNEESLRECDKNHNRNRNLAASVRKLQVSGLIVQGGFILGFDSDPETIFTRMVEFIQETRIVTAMVGLLNAPLGTRLYKRLKEEGRILRSMSGDNTDFSMNFIPAMAEKVLTEGYQKVLKRLYTPEHYYRRVKNFLKEYHPPFHPREILMKRKFSVTLRDISAFARSVWRLGLLGKERFHYWRLLTWTLVHRPRLFPIAVTFSIYGFHFRKIIEM
ncbi:MAG: DUF4070 domain-containing protein [Bacteroidota bacterium]|nr:DUF4070 domain-containing protein [Bacteroidota bacterium]